MNQELKYKVGDRVVVNDATRSFYGQIGVIDEVDLSATMYPYGVQCGLSWGWISETDLSRAASSPDEQDTEKAGGSDPNRLNLQRLATAAANIGASVGLSPDPDPVNHPSHYTSDPSGIECIEITRHRDFLVGNAIKYLWRAGLKESDNPGKETEDLKKAIWYIQQRIELITK